MILIDTSVWIDHFQKNDKVLVNLLGESSVCIHPFIIGELACGNLKNRIEILTLLQSLPEISMAQQEEVLFFTTNYKLYGQGLGYIDMHLIASCFIDNVNIFTRDKKLKEIASEFGILSDF